MRYTSEQVKGRIRNIARSNDADARTLMRIHMMERFLERIAHSDYADNFILKGGILVTAMVGIAHRSTMDIDTSIKNQNLNAEDARRIVQEIASIDLNDGVQFVIKEVLNIMDEMEYPGIRITLDVLMGKMITPIKIDISTGDIITPHAIEYNYSLLLEDRTISLWSYNLETILSEKLQTILARGLLNTRMRDYYDIHMLLSVYRTSLNNKTLRLAFDATCKKRKTAFSRRESLQILGEIHKDPQMQKSWAIYSRKNFYAAGIRYEDVINSVEILIEMVV